MVSAFRVRRNELSRSRKRQAHLKGLKFQTLLIQQQPFSGQDQNTMEVVQLLATLLNTSLKEAKMHGLLQQQPEIL